MGVPVLPCLTSAFSMDVMLEAKGCIFILHHPSTPCAHVSHALSHPKKDRSSALPCSISFDLV